MQGRQGGKEGDAGEEGREGGRGSQADEQSTAQSWGKGCYTVPTSVSYWNTNSGTSIWSGLMVS